MSILFVSGTRAFSSLRCRLREPTKTQSQPARQAASTGGAKPPAAEASASTARASTSQPQAGVREAPNKAEAEAPTHTNRRDKEVKPTDTPAARRDAKDNAHREHPAKDATAPRDAKDTARPPRDTSAVRGTKEHSTRGSREHADKATAREGRHGTAASAKPGEVTADRRADEKLAAARAAALQRKQSTNGDVDAKAAPEPRTSPGKADKGKRNVDGAKDGAANGVTPTAGTKRRAADVPKAGDSK